MFGARVVLRMFIPVYERGGNRMLEKLHDEGFVNLRSLPVVS
jgi:hypothetical protein